MVEWLRKIRWKRMGVRFWVLWTFWLMACAKENRLDCFLSAGPLRTEIRALSAQPLALRVYDDVDVEWIRSDTPKVEFLAGRNLLRHLKSNLGARGLEIRNGARCNWVRDYGKPIRARVFTADLPEVELNGFGEFVTRDTLKVPNLLIRQYGPGKSTVWVQADSLHIGFDAFGRMEAKGTADRAFYFTLGMGHVDAGQVDARSVWVEAEGNQLRVSARDSLRAEVRNTGTVEYRGNPGIRLSARSKGKLMRIP